ncbi:Calx-beta domain-containing protein [Fusibacter sp. JL216-2]|uniref:S-layer homology domain-containing protein n=1 Tax=Fusibacter sp. JL216-2 TaxID=3071453 RepID=UPI003D3500BC
MTRTGGSDGAVTVDYAVTGGTATGSGTDYTLSSGTLSFADSETSKTITVSIVDDGTYESDETVEVTLSNATGGASLGTDTVATLTITDDDALPGTLQFDPTTASVAEDGSTKDLTVTRTGGSDGAVTVDYAVTGGTATGAGTDYTLASGTLSFADSETSKTITVSIVDDSTYESDETVEVTLSNATGGASLGTDTVATLTITDDDALPGTLQFDPTTASVAEDGSTKDLTVTRTGGSDGAVTVDYAVTGGTATGAGTDYTLASGTLSFADSETSKTITVSIVDDSTYESDETVEVTLSNATGGASLGTDKVATLTITDDDALPGTLQFDPTTASVAEDGSTKDLTVTRTGGSDGAVTVGYAVTGGTATGSGTDYTLASGTLSFADSETSKTITVSIVDDSTYESSETVEVTLSNATGGASLGTDTVATLTITDDDTAPVAGVIQFDPATDTASEDAGTKDLTVTRTGGSDGAVTVDYAVTGGTATGSGTDYTLASGTLSFADSETSKTITVSIVDDSTYESSETVEVTLSNSTGGASLGTDKVATLTITDDDTAPVAGVIQFDPATDTASEDAGTKDLTVTRTGGSDGAVTVDYAVTGGTATGSGTDYTLASGTLSFADSETSKTITVSIVDDGTYESDETVEVTLSNATGGASLGTDKVATLTITDDDTAPVAGVIQFDPATDTASEDAGTKDLTVTRTGGSDGAVTVDYAVTGGTATGSGTDYTLASGILSFADSETSKTITVSIVDDSTYESSETVEVTLSNATGGASLGTDKVATLTITDDDTAPVAGIIQFDPVTISVGEGESTAELTVKRTDGSDGAVSVDYAVTSGSAIGLGTDYTLTDGTLNFADGETSKVIEVIIVDDAIEESSETIEVTLSDVAGGASLGTNKSATVTITDNDTAPGTIQFTKVNVSVSENAGTASLPVEMTSTSDGAIKVDYAVTGGNATGSGVDFSLPSGTLIFNAGETSKTVSISIVNDSVFESDEKIIITLKNPTSGFTIGANKSITVTILANDTPPKNSGSSNNDNNESNTNESDTNNDTTNNDNTSNTIIKVNGKTENVGTESVNRVNGKVTRTVIINPTLVENRIKSSVASNQTRDNFIEIPIEDSTSSQVKVSLTGDIVKLLESNDFTVKTSRNMLSYNIPAKEFSIDKVAQSMGIDQDKLESIEVDIVITQSDDDMAQAYENEIIKNNSVLVTKPVEFEILARTRDSEGNEQETRITRFNDYVDRVMEVPEGVDPDQITTGIVFNTDLTYSHVPTIVYEEDGKYYTKLNSLTNSSYSVIWHPVVVEATKGHWSESITNDMASRLILMDYENYDPDKAVTRAEFTDYLVRALGLLRDLDEKDVAYEDVGMDHPYSKCIAIAKDWGIISGYPDNTFRPDEKITREDAMSIYASAMKMTDCKAGSLNKITNYEDLAEISAYALDDVRTVVNSGIFSGRTETHLSPKASLTHAESLAAIRNLLIKSELIQ